MASYLDQPGTIYDPTKEQQQQQQTANRWSFHLANDPFGGVTGEWARRYYDDPNIDPNAALQKEASAFRAQYGSAAPSDDRSIYEMLATGQRPQAQSQSVAAQWTDPQVQQQVSTQQTTENKARADQVWQTLSQLATQSQNVTPDNPIIRSQVDAYRAEQERARRNYISDAAERYGPYANIRGEERMAAERVGQNTAGFQAQAMAQELSAIRNQIMAALQGQQGFVSTDRQQYLQEQLAQIDQQLRSLGMSQDWQRTLMQQDLGLRNLGLQDWDRQMYYDLLQRGVL